MPQQKYSRDTVLKSLLCGEDRGTSPQDTHALSTIYRLKGSIERCWKLYVQKNKKLPEATFWILNLGTFELKLSRRSRDYATVSECVELAKKMSPKHSGLVNAVLRKVADSKGFEVHAVDNYPSWVHSQWMKEQTAERVRDWEESMIQQPSFIVSTEEGMKATESLSEEIRGEVTDQWESEKNFLIQSYSSRFVVERAAALLQHQSHPKVLDLCAGKGTKLLELLKFVPEIQTVATDKSSKQLEVLKETAESQGVHVEVLQLDDFSGDSARRFDLVLVDAPCSGCGTWSKNPRGKWTGSRSKLNQYMKKQKALLQEAKRRLNPGGVIVYSVCSLFFDEGSGHFLEGRDHPVTLDVESLKKWGARFSLCQEGGVLIDPSPGFDGFYLRIFKVN